MKSVKKFLVGGILVIGLFGVIGSNTLMVTAENQDVVNPGPSRIVVRA
ncbi:hypothetical protein [Clostridium senegalense]|nr:hypothetical protein [Clostridium senegalense]MBU5225047.1 hypothetical protein [Clostridium senegalense]